MEFQGNDSTQIILSSDGLHVSVTAADDRDSLNNDGATADSSLLDVSVGGSDAGSTATPIAVAIGIRKPPLAPAEKKPFYLLGTLAVIGLLLAVLCAAEYSRDEADIIPPFHSKDAADTACAATFGVSLTAAVFSSVLFLCIFFKNQAASSPKAQQAVRTYGTFGPFTQPN